MSILFYDKLIVLKGVDKKIEKLAQANDERQELWQMVEEIVHHKVLGCCLTHLPQKHHHEFLEMFHDAPHDKKILKYLNEKTKKNIKKIIRDEIKNLTKDLLFLDSHKV